MKGSRITRCRSSPARVCARGCTAGPPRRRARPCRSCATWRKRSPTRTRLAPQVPRRLAALVTRCLDKDAAERPRSADELLGALDDVAAELRTGRRVHRRTAASAALAAAALTAVVAAAVWRASESRLTGP